MKKLLLKIASIFRRHNWEVDKDWIAFFGMQYFKDFGRVMIRLRCSKCGEVTKEFDITDTKAHKYYNKLFGCKK